MNMQHHPDGTWHTSQFEYKNRKVLIKSAKGKGMKAHIFCENSQDKVQHTLRYSFIEPKKLIEKVKAKIDTQ